MPDANDITTASDSRLLADAITRTLGAGEVAALATLTFMPDGAAPTATRVGAKLLVDAAGTVAAGTTNDEALDRAAASHAAENFLRSLADAHTYHVEEFAPELTAWVGARVLFERLASEPCLIICGAGHVGAALARLARQVGYQVTLIDDRAEFVSRTLFPETGVELVAADDWGQAVYARVGAARAGVVAVVIVTRGHKEDEACLSAALAMRPAYVGMIGSRRRTSIVLARLRAAGADEAALREVRAPVGLDIGAVTPAEVALAILAEIVAARRGGDGLPLSAWRRER